MKPNTQFGVLVALWIAATTAFGQTPYPEIKNYEVRASRIVSGSILQALPRITDVQTCSEACTARAGCNAFTFIPSINSCELKTYRSFKAGENTGYISGVLKQPKPATAKAAVVPARRGPKDPPVVLGGLMRNACSAACSASAGCTSYFYLPNLEMCYINGASGPLDEPIAVLTPVSRSPGAQFPVDANRFTSISVTFLNDSGSELDLYFVSAGGIEDPNPYTAIPSGEVYTQVSTREGQGWRFKRGRQVIAEYTVGALPKQVFVVPPSADPGDSSPPAAPSQPNWSTVVFTNRSGAALKLYFVSAGGVEDPTPYAAIASGESYTQERTRAGQSWRFRLDTKVVAEYKVGPDPMQSFTVPPVTEGSSGGPLSGPTYQQWLRKDQPQFMPKWEPISTNVGNTFNLHPFTMEQFLNNGYHILRMNPMDLTQTGTSSGSALLFAPSSIESNELHMEAGYMVPNKYMVKAILDTKSSESTNTFFSRSERTDAFSLNISLEVGAKGSTGPEGKGPKVGAKYGQEDSTTTSSSSERSVFMATKSAAKLVATLNKEELKLSEPFKTTVRSLRNAGYDRFKTFFESFGTHYPLRTMFGGMAFFQKSYSADEVGKAISSKVSGSVSAKVPVKAVEVAPEIGFSKSKSESNDSGGSTEAGGGWAKGGALGAGFDSWSLGDEAGNFVPIKVDLREIWELVLPEKMGDTDPNAASQTLALRQTMAQMLNRYLAEEEAKYSQSPSHRPRLFSVQIDSIKVTNDDDGDFDSGPDLWGFISLYARKGSDDIDFADHSPGKCVQSLPAMKPLGVYGNLHGCDRWKNWGKDLDDTYRNFPSKAVTSEFPDVAKEPLFLSIAPRIDRKVDAQGIVRYETLYDLDQYDFYPYGYLRDQDILGGDFDDWMTFNRGVPSSISLRDVVNAGGSKTKTASQVAAGLGTVEVQYTVREIDFEIVPEKIKLPDWPDNQ